MYGCRRLGAAIAIILGLLGSTECHLRLTYPIARAFQTDFLDNSRTTGPCGMPEGEVQTELEAGSAFDLTWHLAYAHKGGFVLEILEGADVVRTLTGGEGVFIGMDDTAVQHHEVTLPTDYTCDKCTVRIRRKAAEWGDNYIFWSCADVKIVASAAFTEKCSGHGTASGSSCSCAKLYSGDVCQNKDDCEDDGDCNGGTCVSVASVSYPQKQCYCTAGQMGRTCELVSSITDLTYNQFDYKKVKMSEAYDLLWKIDGDEIEFIMEVESTTWVAVGFKPSDLTNDCRKLTLPGLGEAPYNDNTFHAMDCADIVVGTARDDRFRILDYFTRDRATPREDVFWGGQFSLTGAIGKEENNMTTIRFRRKLTSTDEWDHSVEDKDFRVIWARGQEYGKYIHSPASGFEAGTNKDAEFYKRDELKYHGHAPQRGAKTFNFYAEPPAPEVPNGDCYGSKSLRCEGTDCAYKVEWIYNKNKDSIDFSVQLKTTTSSNIWTGVGFSADNLMQNMDVVLGWIDSTRGGVVEDRWIGGQHSAPVLDTIQDLPTQSSEYTDGVLTITFSRPRDTGEATQDLKFSDDDCYYFFYPSSGGPVVSGNPSYHSIPPEVSTDKICVKACPEPEPAPEATPEPEGEPEGEPSKASYHIPCFLTTLVFSICLLFAV